MQQLLIMQINESCNMQNRIVPREIILGLSCHKSVHYHSITPKLSLLLLGIAAAFRLLGYNQQMSCSTLTRVHCPGGWALGKVSSRKLSLKIGALEFIYNNIKTGHANVATLHAYFLQFFCSLVPSFRSKSFSLGIQVYKKKRRLSRTSRKGCGGWEFFLLLKLTPFKTGAAENHRNKSLTTGSWVPGQRKTRNLYLEKEDCRWGTHNTAHSSVLVRLVPEGKY